MKKNEAKLGMKIKRVGAFEDLEEGTYTIKAFQGANAVSLEKTSGVYLLKNFEPVNKYEVGDEVLFENVLGNKYKVKIFGISINEGKIYYAIEGKYLYDGDYFNCIVTKSSLSPLKKKDQLQPGDKFKRTGTKYEVLAVAYEDFRDSIIYFAKMLNGNLEGRIVDFNSEFVDEIIYD